MQIKPLYIPLQNVKGRVTTKKTLAFKVRLHIKRYNALPKKGFHGYYNESLVNNSELNGHISTLETSIESRLRYLLNRSPEISKELAKSSAPHWSTKAAQWKKLHCKLMCEIGNLCRAKVARNYDSMEVAFYHINTIWLGLNQLVHGDTTEYKDAKNVACVGNFIPPRDRFYGKRRVSK
jgi:hypothetical protein